VILRRVTRTMSERRMAATHHGWTPAQVVTIRRHFVEGDTIMRAARTLRRALSSFSRTLASPTRWTEWPKWDDGGRSFRTPRFQFSCSITDYSGRTSRDKIALLKDRALLEIYHSLYVEQPIRSVLEIGFFQGGMPLFLADMVAPQKIVAVDRTPPSAELLSLVRRNGLSSSIEFIGNVDQADTIRIRSILDERFAEPLDLIIDDCSHYYAESKACFEALFGYLRPGGKYVIEDWGWTHWPGTWQTENPFRGKESMTNLIFELVMGLASEMGVIVGVNVAHHACVIVTRGDQLPHKGRIDLQSMIRLADERQAKLIVPAQSARHATCSPTSIDRS
jgi:SAM-dependent methyltransferase